MVNALCAGICRWSFRIPCITPSIRVPESGLCGRAVDSPGDGDTGTAPKKVLETLEMVGIIGGLLFRYLNVRSLVKRLGIGRALIGEPKN